MTASSRLYPWKKICHHRAASLASFGCFGALWFLNHDEDGHSLRHSRNDAAVSRQALAPYATGSSFMSPILPIRIIRPNPNLEIAYDVRTRNPIYVLEKLNKTNLPPRGGRRKRPHFYEESTIEEEDYRSKLSHYRNSGYDRGHMAPAADFPNSTQDTFTLCNVSPQNHQMNVSIWNLLEEWVRRLVRSQDKVTTTVYVVTGPLWLPHRQVEESKFEYRHLGLGSPPTLVSVPTHFFKVIAVLDDGGGNQAYAPPDVVHFACFVVANNDKLTSNKLEDYVVPWKDLEAVTGLQFFPQWATLEWKDRADEVMKEHVPIASGHSSAANHESRLLLTDSSATAGTGRLARRKKKGRDFADIVHLCSEGKCR